MMWTTIKGDELYEVFEGATGNTGYTHADHRYSFFIVDGRIDITTLIKWASMHWKD